MTGVQAKVDGVLTLFPSIVLCALQVLVHKKVLCNTAWNTVLNKMLV